MMTPEENVTNEPAIRRARLRVAYHGAAFHGFAANADVTTVEGVLEKAITTITRGKVEISTAGRTDAGVHARGQIITVDIPASTQLSALVRSINGICGPHMPFTLRTNAES